VFTYVHEVLYPETKSAWYSLDRTQGTGGSGTEKNHLSLLGIPWLPILFSRQYISWDIPLPTVEVVLIHYHACIIDQNNDSYPLGPITIVALTWGNLKDVTVEHVVSCMTLMWSWWHKGRLFQMYFHYKVTELKVQYKRKNYCCQYGK